MNQKEVSMMYFANRRIRRWLVLGCLLLSFAAGQPALARDPEIMSNLGAITISCSIYPGQAAVAGVATGDTMGRVEEVLGAPQSVKYGRATREYHYPSRTLLFIQYMADTPYVLTDIKTSKWGDATPDGVQVGMGETVLNDVYGQADSVWTRQYDSPKIPAEENAKNHARLDETIYEYHANKTTTLAFRVTRGVIREIHIHQAE